MADTEQTRLRSLAYSAWHRTASIGRFVPMDRAKKLAMTDLDSIVWLECDERRMQPLAILETAIDTGAFKPASVMMALAARMQLPGFVVLIRLATTPNPADTAEPDIAGFRVEWLRLRAAEPIMPLRHFTPRAWAEFLDTLHREPLDGPRRVWRAAPECRESACTIPNCPGAQLNPGPTAGHRSAGAAKGHGTDGVRPDV